ncbi:MAG: phosphoribosylglycinamide formyltransferase [Alphaproteobacteria bacterium]|nr:phosphoribosylglycinamide formyltransferase [Alphaproteobacteria bacterium]
MERLRVGVLISGRGSNLQALIEACRDPDYPAEIVLVISNRAQAPGLARADAAGIPHAIVGHRERHAFAAQAEALLREHRVDFICLAGFMRILDAGFVQAWRDRMVNIHPSLLPAFQGLHAQRQALAAGVRFTGCTVHFVRAELDCGPIIGQAVVPVRPDDDEERLSARILEVEHRLYPLALRLIAEKRVTVTADRVDIEGWRSPEIAALNPVGPAAGRFARTSV